VLVEPPDEDPPDVDPPDVDPPELEELLLVELPVEDEPEPSPHPASMSIDARIGMPEPNRTNLVTCVRSNCRIAIMVALLGVDLFAITKGMAGQYGGNMRVNLAVRTLQRHIRTFEKVRCDASWNSACGGSPARKGRGSGPLVKAAGLITISARVMSTY
jgi:hypothetical protein